MYIRKTTIWRINIFMTIRIDDDSFESFSEWRTLGGCRTNRMSAAAFFCMLPIPFCKARSRQSSLPLHVLFDVYFLVRYDYRICF